MSSDPVWIARRGELDPGLIRPLTGDEYLGVVMPMRYRATGGWNCVAVAMASRTGERISLDIFGDATKPADCSTWNHGHGATA